MTQSRALLTSGELYCTASVNLRGVSGFGIFDGDCGFTVGGVLDDDDAAVNPNPVVVAKDGGVSTVAEAGEDLFPPKVVDGEGLFPMKEMDELAFDEDEEEEDLEEDPIAAGGEAMIKPGGVRSSGVELPTEDPVCESGDGAGTSWTCSSLLRT